MFDTTRAYPGTADTLRALADTHAMALLTNKPADSARKVLAHCGSTGSRHMIFGDGEFAASRTGRPEVAHEAHRATVKRTILVGDSEVDLATARAGGVRVCLARYGFGFVRVDPATLAGDEWFIDQPQDLLGLCSSAAGSGSHPDSGPGMGSDPALAPGRRRERV